MITFAFNIFRMTTPILICYLSNLTDARYFAARAIPYVHFHIGDNGHGISEQAFAEIINWVSGPEIIVSLENKEYAAFLQKHPNVAGILVDKEDAGLNIPDGFLVLKKEQNAISDGKNLVFTYFDLPAEALAHDGESGYAIAAGDEIATGIRDYEQWDELLDKYAPY